MQVIVAERGPMVMVFNFNPHQSFEGLRVGAGLPGKYKPVLSTDEWRFGGRGRVGFDVDHFTFPEGVDSRPCSMFVFAPSRRAGSAAHWCSADRCRGPTDRCSAALL